MIFDLSQITNALGAISSIAVIAGAVFIVLQLRQNGVLLNSTLRQEKKQAAFSMLERLTNESFAKRRSNFYHKIDKYRAANWEGFDDSEDDFEIRNYAYLYELYGQLVRDGSIDFHMVADMLQYLAVLDWKKFEPVAEHYAKRFGPIASWWRDFKWLAVETEKHMSERSLKSSFG